MHGSLEVVDTTFGGGWRGGGGGGGGAVSAGGNAQSAAGKNLSKLDNETEELSREYLCNLRAVMV
jgi:hypothetical protein